MADSRIPVSCATCGMPRLVWPSGIARGEGKYCSISCYRSGAHGEIHSPEYVSWTEMKRRCRLNPARIDSKNYGARGITVCAAWRDSFPAFLSDVGRRPSPKHSIDRWPDNNRGYEPGNVRWATQAEQQRNRRDTVLLMHDGEMRCMSEWADLLGMDKTTLHGRLKRGWSVERALTTPLRHHL